MKKRIISIVLTTLILLSIPVTAMAKKSESPEKYPYILVHGMMGWGTDVQGVLNWPYFQTDDGKYMVDELKEAGYEAYAPNLGPLSSAWDRACELYAQLTGTKVDYGAAHSAKYGHKRYGRDYTGKGFLSKDWYKNGKINLIGHSFAGPTMTIFTNMLAYGSKEEKKASPKDCSEFFKGGYSSCVYSVTSMAGVQNGTPMANILYDSDFIVDLASALINLVGTSKKPIVDFMLDQFDVTANPANGERAKINLKNIKNMAKSDDHCIYDMTIEAMEKFNKTYKIVPSIYYFSYSGDITKELTDGVRIAYGGKKMDRLLKITATVILLMKGKKYGSTVLDESWMSSDGMVPNASSAYPSGQPHINYAGQKTLKSGVWYVMPTVEGVGHNWFSGAEGFGMTDLFTEIIEHIKITAK